MTENRSRLNWSERWLHSMKFMDDAERQEFLTRMIPQFDNPFFGVDKNAFLAKAARMPNTGIKEYIENNTDHLLNNVSYETSISFGWAYTKALFNKLYDRIGAGGRKIPAQEDSDWHVLNRTGNQLTCAEANIMSKYLEGLEYPTETTEQMVYQSQIMEKIAIAVYYSSQSIVKNWQFCSQDEQEEFLLRLSNATDYALRKNAFTAPEITAEKPVSLHEIIPDEEGEERSAQEREGVQGRAILGTGETKLKANKSFSYIISVLQHERTHHLSYEISKDLPDNHPHKSIKKLGEIALGLFKNNMNTTAPFAYNGVYWDQAEERLARANQESMQSKPLYLLALSQQDIRHMEEIFRDAPEEFDFIRMALDEYQTRLAPLAADNDVAPKELMSKKTTLKI